ncbi:hypothetical protein ACFOU0_00695 [Salinicoccus sesuvii]|uniref:Uncharacterized protein n=1 Tax=Salinicoccus sesuvii TaxID=868281 RepID=A0ABV7N1I7_9STAP
MKSYKWFLTLVLLIVVVLGACGHPGGLESGEASEDASNDSGETSVQPERSDSLAVWLDGENQVEV